MSGEFRIPYFHKSQIMLLFVCESSHIIHKTVVLAGGEQQRLNFIEQTFSFRHGRREETANFKSVLPKLNVCRPFILFLVVPYAYDLWMRDSPLKLSSDFLWGIWVYKWVVSVSVYGAILDCLENSWEKSINLFSSLTMIDWNYRNYIFNVIL